MHLRPAFLCFLLLALPALNAEITVNARFEPARVALNNASRYTIEIVETDSSAMPQPDKLQSMPIPNNASLTLRNGQISSGQQTQAINGRITYTRTVTLAIDAIPNSVGTTTIPSYKFPYKGRSLTAPAVTLTVVEHAADATPRVDELLFLTTQSPEKLYVGQTTPITLKLYSAREVRLTGISPFEREADGFIISTKTEKYIESNETINGRRYSVLSWPMTITPISAGPQDLNFNLTASAQMPGNRSNRRSSPFGSSIMNDFFGRSERFEIHTKPHAVNVLRLPSTGKPSSFSGAIGDFRLEATTDAKATKVGEPIMLSLKISGIGNFDRIQAPKLPTGSNWRSYKPETFFEGDDSTLGLRGIKRFDYIFIPEKAGQLKLPEIKFSFFDPNTKKYVELNHPAIPVTVAPSDRFAPPPTNLPVQHGSAPSDTPESLQTALTPEQVLLTLDYRPQKGRAIQPDLPQSSWLYTLNAAAAALLITFVVIARRKRRLRENMDYALAHQAKKELKATLAQTKSNDSETFYQAAQTAIRLALTARIGRNLRSADLSEIEQALATINVSEKSRQSTQTLFQAADNQRFSGQSTSADLAEARTQLNSILKAL